MKKTTIYITSPEYGNSRFINYNLWSRSAEVDALVAHLYKEFGFNFSDYKINLKMIVMNLYQSYLVDSTQYVNYFRTTNKYKFIDKYHPNKNITSTYAIKSVDRLLECGYIDHRAGKHFENDTHGASGYTSTMRAKPKLIELIDKYCITPSMIDMFDEDAGVIEKKSKSVKYAIVHPDGRKETVEIKPVKLDFTITRAVGNMITVLRNYNRLLMDTYIDLDIECLSESDIAALKDKLANDNESNTSLDLTKKRVKRVFNNDSWHQGGRFYGAWWMGCPSVLRKYIYLDGLPTVELDYSGIHIHLLYALKGINYAVKNEDPYSLTDNDPLRPLNKVILLTAINAKSPDSTVKAVMNDLTTEDKLIYKVAGEQFLKDQLELLKLKHIPIADSIASGKGI